MKVAQKRACVYYLAAPNGKLYIGKTVWTLERRLRSHEHSKRYLGHAICKYGVENFVMESVFVGPEAECYNMERHLIAALDTQDRTIGYNIRDGGDGFTSADSYRVNALPHVKAAKRRSGRRHGNSSENLERLRRLNKSPEGRERARRHGNSPECRAALARGCEIQACRAAQRREGVLVVLRNRPEGVSNLELQILLGATPGKIRCYVFSLRYRGHNIVNIAAIKRPACYVLREGRAK